MRRARDELLKPVERVVHANSLIRDEYRLQFKAHLCFTLGTLSDQLFSLIKQNSKEFRGEDESFETLKNLADKFNFEVKEDVLAFVEQLHEKIEAISGSSDSSPGVFHILRKHATPRQVYDLLFGLSFLAPRYTLLFQDTELQHLSPGQRGSLLLIFYLLVDQGSEPIILDQPEENLDNETVMNLLVPVLEQAKRQRQVIMVTHNPNLAVVCDAEPIVYCQFDRKTGSKITYSSGAIEDPAMRKHVINVREGTMPAFNNRRDKYMQAKESPIG